jgi:FkbM family methyltransferase
MPWNHQVPNIRYETCKYFKAPINTYFSQYNQDRSLEINIFKGFKKGVFMDVGAHDGVDLNNTLYFETTHEWTGINIEPIKEVYDRCVTNRPNCLNINCAVSDTDGTAQFMLNTGYTEMLSGLVKEYNERHLQRIIKENELMGGKSEICSVETKTISTICRENNISHIHYLTIDVEGGEMAVIRSINFDEVFIDVIGFENNSKDTEHIPIDYLLSKGYILLPDHVADVFMLHHQSKFM